MKGYPFIEVESLSLCPRSDFSNLLPPKKLRAVMGFLLEGLFLATIRE
jgi:hypothetical protein